jgi:flagellar basal body-associated protein FliL
MAEAAKKKPEDSKGGAGAAGAAPAADKSAEKKDGGSGGGHSAAAAAGATGGLLTRTPVLLGGAMIIEAAVLFAGFKFLGGGGPRETSAAVLTTEETTPSDSHGDAKSESHEGGGAGAGGHGDAKSEGASGGSTSKIDKKKAVEVQIVDFRAPNKQSGRTFLYDVTIFAVTKGEYKERVEVSIKEHEALIKDRVRTIIAQMDPEKLGGGSEPGLETLRRQVKYQLDEIVGEGMIDEVLVSRCIPFRTDY